MTDVHDLVSSLDEQNQARNKQQEKQANLEAVSTSSDKVVSAVEKGAQETVSAISATKPDTSGLAKSNDIDAVIKQLKEVQLASLMANSSKDAPVIQVDFADLGTKITELGTKFDGIAQNIADDTSSVDLTKQLDKLFNSFFKQINSTLAAQNKTLQSSISKIDTKPVVNVPETRVNIPNLDLLPIIEGLSKVEKAVSSSKMPETSVDLSEVTGGLSALLKAIQALRFPVPNYVLPFASATGKAVQVKLNDDGTVPVQATISTVGLATSAGQDTGNATLSTIATNTSGSAVPSTIVAFVTAVSTAGTRVQLGTNTTAAGIVQAPSTNTGIIYVGGSNVSSSVYGAELQPGQASGIAISNTNKIYIDASVNGDKCAFLGS